ncbi:hypothetical protein Z043_121797 [Scleropages formosus]|uniref:G-protein coupled receptors family 3 profile domain-containing protein n=1 Tax=Scleropages formosus TaxID=113540 RepID=A0A0P7Y3L1_SCLFO|nr:hypothetical protein Z043_121797 [Scleropages formosus]
MGTAVPGNGDPVYGSVSQEGDEVCNAALVCTINLEQTRKSELTLHEKTGAAGWSTVKPGRRAQTQVVLQWWGGLCGGLFRSLRTGCDSTKCIKCPLEYWSNEDRPECIHTMGKMLTAISVIGASLTAATGLIFFHFMETPTMKANNSELLFLLTLCFLCSLIFTGQPSQ